MVMNNKDDWIREAFAVLGLDTEESRTKFCVLGRLGKKEAKEQVLIRVSDNSKDEGYADAQLARIAK